VTTSHIGKLHIELVCLVDLRSNQFYWTGKTYPTTGQEHGLVRMADAMSHFVYLPDVGQVMIPGCHDLTLFNNRNWGNTGVWRKRLKTDFRNLARQAEPVCVLHHPHTTVKMMTWRSAWRRLCCSRALPKRHRHLSRKARSFDAERTALKAVLLCRSKSILLPMCCGLNGGNIVLQNRKGTHNDRTRRFGRQQ
jgi:hypothetical protein